MKTNVSAVIENDKIKKVIFELENGRFIVNESVNIDNVVVLGVKESARLSSDDFEPVLFDLIDNREVSVLLETDDKFYLWVKEGDTYDDYPVIEGMLDIVAMKLGACFNSIHEASAYRNEYLDHFFAGEGFLELNPITGHVKMMSIPDFIALMTEDEEVTK